MSKEILMVAEAVSNEKGVDRAVIFDAMEQALAMATAKTAATKTAADAQGRCNNLRNNEKHEQIERKL